MVSSLQMIINMFMIVPLWVVGNSIQIRHQKILAVQMPVFPEETRAYELVSFLKWFLPLFVAVFWVVDCCLILLFHLVYHPWVEIVKEDSNGDKERILQQTRDAIEDINQKIMDKKVLNENIDIFFTSTKDLLNTKQITGMVFLKYDQEEDFLNMKIRAKVIIYEEEKPNLD